MADSDFDYDIVDSYGESDIGDDSYGESDPGDDSYGHGESDVEEEYHEGYDSEEEYDNKESDVEEEYHEGSDSEEAFDNKESADEDDFCQSSKGTKSYNYGGNSKASYKDIAPRQSNNQQWTTRNNIVDKQSGAYVRTTVKQSSSSGDIFKERSTGRIGYKDEFKTTSTFKVGDKGGYSEYQKEERFRRVDYGNSSGGGSMGKSSGGGSMGKSSYSSNKYLK